MRPSLQKNRYTLRADEYKAPVINTKEQYAVLYTRKDEPVKVDLSVFEYVKSKWPFYVGNCGQVMRARRRSDKEQYRRFSIIQLSREIFGFPPQKYRVYFINGNKQDCRIANMRLVETDVSQKLHRSRRKDDSPHEEPSPELSPADYSQYIDNEMFIKLKTGLDTAGVRDIRKREISCEAYADTYNISQSKVRMIWAGNSYKNLFDD